MSTDLLEPSTKFAEPEENFEQYRALSASAVVSLLLGLVSLMGFISAPLLVIAVVAAGLGLYSVVTIRRSTEHSGAVPATIGLLLAVVTLGIGAPWHVYTYLTEVPPGAERISFADLQPDPEHPELPVSKTALELNGKRVFLKGYVHPLAPTGPIRNFTLVADMGTCCFGGDPKPTHMIDVHIPDNVNPTSYSRFKKSLCGTLVVHTQLQAREGFQGVFYELNVESIK